MAAAGLWRGARWGRTIALVMLAINFIADLTNVILGIDRRAAIGLPIVAALIFYLRTSTVRRFFARD
jgi:uncharacterized membrane protein (DUF2068 family)